MCPLFGSLELLDKRRCDCCMNEIPVIGVEFFGYCEFGFWCHQMLFDCDVLGSPDSLDWW